jgi:hypothetical protein
MEEALSRFLAEAAPGAKLGTVVGWRTSAGKDYGVVIGKDGSDLLCLSYYNKQLKAEAAFKKYRDVELTEKLKGKGLPKGLMADVQRVPIARAFARGRLAGAALKPYVNAAAHLQLEHEMPAVRLAPGFREVSETLAELSQAFDLRESLRWIRQKHGAAAAAAHRDFLAMVRKDPAAHRRKMQSDRRYHRQHRFHDALMRKTARKGFRRQRR